MRTTSCYVTHLAVPAVAPVQTPCVVLMHPISVLLCRWSCARWPVTMAWRLARTRRQTEAPRTAAKVATKSAKHLVPVPSGRSQQQPPKARSPSRSDVCKLVCMHLARLFVIQKLPGRYRCAGALLQGLLSVYLALHKGLLLAKCQWVMYSYLISSL